MPRIACPKCGVSLQLPDERIGRRVRCPSCKNGFVASVTATPPVAPVMLVQSPTVTPRPGVTRIAGLCLAGGFIVGLSLGGLGGFLLGRYRDSEQTNALLTRDDPIAEMKTEPVTEKKTIPVSLTKLVEEFAIDSLGAGQRYGGQTLTFQVVFRGPIDPRPIEDHVVLADPQAGAPEIVGLPAAGQAGGLRALGPGKTATIRGTISVRKLHVPYSLPPGRTYSPAALHRAMQEAALQPPVEIVPPGGFALRDVQVVRP